MAKNASLNAASVAKQDEFYTQYKDIQDELNHYEKHFKNKTVLCNCDDPFESNFCKFFLRNFNYLGLKRLICTSYSTSTVVGKQMTLFDWMNEPVVSGNGYVMDISKVPMANGRGVSDEDIDNLLKSKKCGVRKLKGDGDFRSEECIEYLKQADIVVTNPPFSLFREYISLLMKYDKKFLIIGNQNNITYKEIFPLIQQNKIWLGCKFGDMAFRVPDHYEPRATRFWVDENGQKWRSFGTICWYTNLDHEKRHEKLILYKNYYGNEGDYPKYDNYDAINVNKVADIPKDYFECMAVPITYVEKHNPEQFEIVNANSIRTNPDTPLKGHGLIKDKDAVITTYYWIRPSSLTTIAKQGEIAELFEKFNAIPYDDRVNRMAKLEVIRRGYLEDFLRDSNSSLVDEMNNRSLEDLLLSLEVANETDTGIELKNIAVLMFSERPDKLIPGAQIDLIQFNSVDAEAGDDFIEKTFTGPIWKQVNDALGYIKTNVIVSKVNKIKNEQKADSYYNYPYNALEEAIVNAVFHKSYRDASPVEIRIYVNKIMIINFPGPDKWINMDKFAKGEIRARKYRNRRIGELFKEINLSEKQGTGIPKILRELKVNGSPLPIFETDEDRTYLETTILEHEGFEKEPKRSQKGAEREPKKGAEREQAIMELLIQNPHITQLEMAEKLELTRKQVQNVIKGLQEDGIIEREGSNRNGKWIVNKYV